MISSGRVFWAASAVQLQHDADGDRVEVGVDEAAAVDAAGAADDLDVDALAAAHPKRSSMTSFGSASVSFTPSVKFLAFGVAVEAGLLGEEAVDAVAGDHDVAR